MSDCYDSLPPPSPKLKFQLGSTRDSFCPLNKAPDTCRNFTKNNIFFKNYTFEKNLQNLLSKSLRGMVSDR